MFDKALNETFAGVLLGSVNRPFVQTAAAGFGELSLFMTSPLMAVMEACAQAAQVNICRSGYDRLINAADGNPQTARRIWEFLQNGHDLAAMLGRAPQGVSVTIGGENSRTELGKCSVITARYAADESLSGVLAVISSMRTDYARTLSVLQCTAETVGELIDGLIEL